MACCGTAECKDESKHTEQAMTQNTHFFVWPGKYLMYLLSWRDRYLIVSAQIKNKK